MSTRGHTSAPGLMRHGPPPRSGAPADHHPLDSRPPAGGAQVAEIDRLVMENRRLATSIVAMKEDLATAEEEIRRLRAHIRSTETESDIQIRVLLEKVSKMELGIKAGESVKKDLQQAHKEAQSLVAVRQELTLKIQQATQELDKCHNDVKRIPDMLSELESMQLEHQRLRSAFEHEKRINLDLVEHLRAMESNLVGMSKEVELLRSEVLNVEKRVQAPYGGAYPTPDPQHRSPYQGNDPYYDPYRRAAMEGMAPHGNANGPRISGATGPMAWGDAYDPNIARK